MTSKLPVTEEVIAVMDIDPNSS